MNVLIAVNSDYIMPSRVMFHSLLINNPCSIRLFVFYRVLAEDEKNMLRRDAEESGHAQVDFIEVNRKGLEEGPWRLRWITVETYYRLFAQELLPEDVDRVLWLDGDMIVRGSLEAFYNQDMEGKLLCACGSDAENESHCSDPFPKDLRYFNAGVLLYDLKAQRACIDPTVYWEIMECFGDRLNMGDQDILNQVFYRRVKYAESHVYNEMAYDVDSEEKLTDVLILHYNGVDKPWKYTGLSRWGNCFWKYAEDFPEYRRLKPGILAAQKQYETDQMRMKKIDDMLDKKRKAYTEMKKEVIAEAKQRFDKDARYQLSDGVRLIRTGTQNMLLMEPEKRMLFNELLRLNETGAFLVECLNEPRTSDEMARLLAAQGHHNFRDAHTNARNLLKLLNEYHLIQKVPELG